MKTWGLPEWARHAIVDAYATKEKVAAISAEFGVTDSCVRMLARRHGIPPRQIQRKGAQSSSPMLVTETEGR